MLTSCLYPIIMVGILDSEKAPLTRLVLAQILALMMSISTLAWGMPSAHAECPSGCCCESGKSATGPGMEADARNAAPDCCGGPEGVPCSTALDRGSASPDYALAAESWEETPLPASSAPEAALVGLTEHRPPRATGPWKAPPATPGPPLYLSHLSLLI